MYKYGDDTEDFDKVFDQFDVEMDRRGFYPAIPQSREWEIAGSPWIKEQDKYQIWVYMVPSWKQSDVWGKERPHHSIYGHIQKGRIINKFELKPKSVATLKSMIPSALSRIDGYLKDMEKLTQA
jgi:hypothetical protein